MPEETGRPASYGDVLDAPAHMVAELIEGALHLHPRPASRHALAGSSLGIEIGGPFQKGRNGPGGWWILDEPELHLGPDVLVPDLAGWRRERMPDFPDTPWFELPPDWVCEVLSPGTRRTDLTDKRRLYAGRRGSPVSGSWIRPPGPSRPLSFGRAAGCWPPPSRTTRRCGSRPSRRSPSRSGPSGRTRPATRKPAPDRQAANVGAAPALPRRDATR